MPLIVRSVTAFFVLVVWLIHTQWITSAQCLNHHKTFLLNLRHTIEFDPLLSTKLIKWNESTDCCGWNGVECDPLTGQVIGLDLSNETITGGLDNSSSLFSLISLQSLNLAWNSLMDVEIPSAFGKLTNLTYLNLSEAGFGGQVPTELSQLVNLAVLDMSYSCCREYSTLHIENPNLNVLMQNLTNLKELYLDRVMISANGKTWCEAISSSLHQLQVLSMVDCNLTGEIHPSLLKLESLSVIRLYGNNLASLVPEFLTNFKYLKTLNLGGCGLMGKVPENIFHVPTLENIDLSDNFMLHGTLPDFSLNSSLQTLILSITGISGPLPNSINNLRRLRRIELFNCSFSGTIPSSIGYLKQLEYLDLSGNSFSGNMPTFSLAKNLSFLSLANNNLNGSITSIDWGGFRKMEYIDFSNNSLNGAIPMSLFSLPSIQKIILSFNHFSQQLDEFVSPQSSKVDTLELNNNFLDGEFPKSLLHLKGLKVLNLSFNRFNGTLYLKELFKKFKNLASLDLSYNFFAVDTSGISASSSVPHLGSLKLASCNLGVLPNFLRSQSMLKILDLSSNRIQGKVPSWFWKVGNGDLFNLNLSCNNFTDLGRPSIDLPYLASLDLHSNKFHGKIQVVPSGVVFLDYSNNNFTSVSPEIGNYLNIAMELSLSRNSIYGSIPTSLCNAKNLEVLDLSYNHLNGVIPSCLLAKSSSLAVLNLRGNNLTGSIPDEFDKSCRLETIDFNKNFLRGKIPESIGNCLKLKVLDLGNNHLHGTIPFHLRGLSSLQVLILRSNKLHGLVTCTERCSMWSSLQVVDLAFNNFSDELTSAFLLTWNRMMLHAHEEQSSQLRYLQYTILPMSEVYYKDAMTVTLKGYEYSIPKILLTFTSIDLSNNAFHGELPKEMGNLIGLRMLNLSHNSFTGVIPSSIGNLTLLESLDLSNNAFKGRMPPQMANLNFLDYLNLSYNNLSGKIPTSTQLQSFDASSYIGNPGLYGPPLTPSDTSTPVQPPTTTYPEGGSTWSLEAELEWMLRGAEVGFSAGITLFIVMLLYIKKWRDWYWYHVDRVLFKVLTGKGRGKRWKI